MEKWNSGCFRAQPAIDARSVVRSRGGGSGWGSRGEGTPSPDRTWSGSPFGMSLTPLKSLKRRPRLVVFRRGDPLDPILGVVVVPCVDVTRLAESSGGGSSPPRGFGLCIFGTNASQAPASRGLGPAP
jgi:hypothetical protein